MISYCIASYRPVYSELLIKDLIKKTSVPFEILVWLNLDDPKYEKFLSELKAAEYPVKVLGKTPENIGMEAYSKLFRGSQYEMIAQIDDDVICVSRRIAEHARKIFSEFTEVKQLTSDVWQDKYTTGARPPLSVYIQFDKKYGLYNGPIDGWFSIYHRSILPMILQIHVTKYFPIGAMVKNMLIKKGLRGLLCTKFKVFHVIGPAYAHFYDMLDFEIRKYEELGRQDIVQWYQREKQSLPSKENLAMRVSRIIQTLDRFGFI